MPVRSRQHPPLEKRKGGADDPPLPAPTPEQLLLCAPSRSSVVKTSGTCLLPSEIDDLTRAYNTSSSHTQRVHGHDSATRLRDLRRFTHTPAGQDFVLLDRPFVKKNRDLHHRLSHDAFRPPSPSSWERNPRTWLSNHDIDAVMVQYEKAHRDFKFLGVLPVDFNETLPGIRKRCVVQSMCKIDVSSLWKQGFRYLGAVFNMDRHDQPGSHWASLYVSLDPGALNYGAYYYDSVGKTPPPQVTKFMQFVRDGVVASSRNTRVFEIRHNNTKRQFKNTECGVFSIFSLTVLLSNTMTFDEMCVRMGNDDEIHKLRRIFFRPAAAAAF